MKFINDLIYKFWLQKRINPDLKLGISTKNRPNIVSNENLYLQKSSIHGYGVFSQMKIMPDELIEKSSFIPIFTDTKYTPNAVNDYLIKISSDCSAIAFGYMSLYNHNYQPNAYVIYNKDTNMIEMYATKVIQPGEEIVWNYGTGYWEGRKKIPK
jgi:SET domain-containing protein